MNRGPEEKRATEALRERERDTLLRIGLELSVHNARMFPIQWIHFTLRYSQWPSTFIHIEYCIVKPPFGAVDVLTMAKVQWFDARALMI